MKTYFTSLIVSIIVGLGWTGMAVYAFINIYGWATFWLTLTLAALCQGWNWYSISQIGKYHDSRDLENAVERAQRDGE